MSRLISSQYLRLVSRKVLRIRWMMQVCTIAWGQTLLTTSGRPFSPSQITKNVSLIPRLRRSVSTAIQNFAPSPPAPAQSPRMSRSPARLTPMAAKKGRLATCPSRDLHHDRIDEHRRVNLVQWPDLPVVHLLDHLV